MKETSKNLSKKEKVILLDMSLRDVVDYIIYQNNISKAHESGFRLFTPSHKIEVRVIRLKVEKSN